VTTPEIVYQSIRTAYFERGSPVLTAQDLADQVDVTRPTIYKHLDEVKEMPGIRTDTIGQAQVYWYEPRSSDSEMDSETTMQRRRHFAWNDLLGKRARCLDVREQLRQAIISETTDLELQLALIAEMSRYLLEGTDWVNWDTVHAKQSFAESDWFNDPDETAFEAATGPKYQLGEHSGLSDEQTDYYLHRAHIFRTRDDRDVIGLGEFLMPYYPHITKTLEDEKGNIDIAEADPANIRPLLPPPRQLLTAADIVDEFVTNHFKIKW